MMSKNIRNIGIDSWWKGYRLIVIDQVAGEIPQSFLSILLSRCQEMHVSLELCVFSREEKQRLSVAFILRCEGSTRYVVQGKLDDLVQALMPQFEENGFDAHLAGQNDEVQKDIDHFFGGDQSPYNMGLGFFPEDKLLGPRSFYAPGKYGADTLTPIVWGQLASILTRYPMSMMCIQLLNTTLSPTETKFLKASKAYFSKIKDDMHAMEAQMIYDQLLSLENKHLFFANVFCIGSELFAKDVSALMRTWKYKTFPIPPQEIQKSDYLFFGDHTIKTCTTRHGHMQNCSRLSLADAQFLRLTHLITPEDAATLFPLPYQTANISGLTVKRFFPSPVLIPTKSCYQDDAQMIYLGRQEGADVRLGMQLKDLRRHGFIVGKSGCGKTTFAMGLLHQLNQLGIPFLVIEPAKCEYRSLLPLIDDLKIYTPGLSGVAPVQINIFLPPKGVTLEQYLPALNTIFGAAVSMDYPLNIILPQVIRLCYNHYGWRSTSTRNSKGVQLFGMTEFVKYYKDYIRDKYAEDKEALESLESGGTMRLTKLLSNQPLLFDTSNGLDFEELLQHPTIIELDAIRDDQQRSLIMITVLVQTMLCIQQRSTMDSSLKNVILIDEAHMLLSTPSTNHEGASNPSGTCIRYLQDMVKILRSYGTGIFFGDQSPEKLTQDIMEHVNLKIMFQQDSPQSRSILRALTRMDEDMSEDMIDLRPGCGYVFLDAGLPKPVKIYTPNYKKELKLRDDVSNADVARMMCLDVGAPFPQCTHCTSCENCCHLALRIDAKYIADRILDSKTFADLLQPETQEEFFSTPKPLDDAMIAQQQEQKLRAYFATQFEDDVAAFLAEHEDIHWPTLRLRDCIRLHTIRGLLLNINCLMDESSLLKLLDPEAAVTNPAAPASGMEPQNKLIGSQKPPRETSNTRDDLLDTLRDQADEQA